MAPPGSPDPVKLFVAALWAERSALEDAQNRLATQWGPVDFEGGDHLFDVTDYYETEMGRGLRRRILSFQRLVSPDFLAAAKLTSNEVEDRLRIDRGRPVNLDVGYLDHHKVVLASLKFAGQKVYLSRGVYADLVCRFRKGRYESFEWTFPDFRDGRYEPELLEIRRRYMIERRAGPSASG